jgi:hypothetical protein
MKFVKYNLKRAAYFAHYVTRSQTRLSSELLVYQERMNSLRDQLHVASHNAKAQGSRADSIKDKSKATNRRKFLQSPRKVILKFGTSIVKLNSTLLAFPTQIKLANRVSQYRAKCSLLRSRLYSTKTASLTSKSIDRVRTDFNANILLYNSLLEEVATSYGCIVNGQPDWARRWLERPGQRILLLAPKDYSGSFFKWTESINLCTPYAARMLVFRPHQYKYSLDLLSPAVATGDWSGVRELIAEADIIHIKDESGFFQKNNNLPPELLNERRNGVPVVYTAYGGFFRVFRDSPEFRDHVLNFDARIAMTPDLITDWFDGHFIPHAIDTDTYRYSWSDGNRITHSPSTAARKGTDDFMAAIDYLKSEPLDIELDLISGVLHKECIARKRHAALFFDQAGRERKSVLGTDAIIGWYGNSALEAATHGIPTIAHLSQASFDGARRAGRDIESSCAIINTPLGKEGIAGVIRNFFKLTPEERREISMQTRAWMEAFHSYRACGEMLAKCYSQLIGEPRDTDFSLGINVPQAQQEARANGVFHSSP